LTQNAFTKIEKLLSLMATETAPSHHDRVELLQIGERLHRSPFTLDFNEDALLSLGDIYRAKYDLNERSLFSFLKNLEPRLENTLSFLANAWKTDSKAFNDQLPNQNFSPISGSEEARLDNLRRHIQALSALENTSRQD
jgi:hypothetical protein